MLLVSDNLLFVISCFILMTFLPNFVFSVEGEV